MVLRYEILNAQERMLCFPFFLIDRNQKQVLLIK